MLVLDRRAWPVRTLDRLDQPSAAGALLAPLGGLYGLTARLWRGLRRPTCLPRPPLTVGVGNLRVGGTGKTPVVGDLARRWRARGRRVGVATRGYRAAAGDDEPGWLTSLELRVFVDGDRRRAARNAAAEDVEVLLLDDALQTVHQPQVLLAILLDRDLRRMPRTLPAGPAREGAGALGRADALLVRVESDVWPLSADRDDHYQRVALARTGGRAFAFRLAPRELVAADGRRISWDEAEAARPCVLVSGLARPESFESDCRRMGLDALASVRLPDHADPSRGDVAAVESLVARVGATCLVCPEKNWSRLRRWTWSQPLYAVRSEVEWAGEDPVGFVESLVARR